MQYFFSPGYLWLVVVSLTAFSLCAISSNAFGQEDVTNDSSPMPRVVEFRIQEKLFLLELPEWWDEVEVALPETETHEEFTQYVREFCKKDTGTAETWKSAFKLWVLYEQTEDEPFPVYPAHCLRAGGQYLAAAKIYSQLQMLGKYTDNQAWYETYLAYSAGNAFFEGGQEALAEAWYEKGLKDNSSTESSVIYYFNKCQENLDAVQAGMTPHGLRRNPIAK